MKWLLWLFQAQELDFDAKFPNVLAKNRFDCQITNPNECGKYFETLWTRNFHLAKFISGLFLANYKKYVTSMVVEMEKFFHQAQFRLEKWKILLLVNFNLTNRFNTLFFRRCGARGRFLTFLLRSATFKKHLTYLIFWLYSEYRKDSLWLWNLCVFPISDFCW